jgi:hypothetical protein
MQSFEDGNGLRMTQFDIANNGIAADQLIESKHNAA